MPVQPWIEELLEDYAVARLIEEHCDEHAFDREPALAYYQSLEKAEEGHVSEKVFDRSGKNLRQRPSYLLAARA